MRKLTIVESFTEPNKDNLWFYGGTLKWFSANGWEMVNMSPDPTIPANYDISLLFITDNNTAYRFKITDSNLIGYNMVGLFDEHIFIKGSSRPTLYPLLLFTVNGTGDLKAIFNSDNILVPDGTTVTQILINNLQYTLGTEVTLSKDTPNEIQVFVEWANKINLHLKYSDTIYKVNFSVRDSGDNNILNYIPYSPFFVQDSDLKTSIPSPGHKVRLVFLENITKYDYGCAKLSSGLIIEFSANLLPLLIAGTSDNITDITIYPGVHANEIETVFPDENTTISASIS